MALTKHKHTTILAAVIPPTSPSYSPRCSNNHFWPAITITTHHKIIATAAAANFRYRICNYRCNNSRSSRSRK